MMAEANGEWHLSRDGEAYGADAYASRDEAVADAIAMWDSVVSGRAKATELFCEEDARLGRSRFHVGRRMEWRHEVDEDSVIYEAQEDACDYAGEYAEGWLDDLSAADREKLRARLQEAFDGWLAETGREPSFFMVEFSEELDAAGCAGAAARG